MFILLKLKIIIYIYRGVGRGGSGRVGNNHHPPPQLPPKRVFLFIPLSIRCRGEKLPYTPHLCILTLSIHCVPEYKNLVYPLFSKARYKFAYEYEVTLPHVVKIYTAAVAMLKYTVPFIFQIAEDVYAVDSLELAYVIYDVTHFRNSIIISSSLYIRCP